ncbi:MAG: coenzyme F420-0:L-glutamate ligase [Methanosarcinales archaeon Met12]|nr:MAG: coenzyme F420-0:L-glutamate ligase [Methanosarcinales archaeon Met12]
MTLRIEAFTVTGIPMIQKGDDIGVIISELAQLEHVDIVLIASTIVSKSEGRVLALDDIAPREDANRIAHINQEDPRFVQAVLDESDEMLIEAPFMLTKIKCGHTCVNAGVDRSNVEDGFIVPLPENPDASAKRIKDVIFDRTGKRVGIVITDTCGRPFRIGQTGVAVGCAGVPAMRAWKGKKDLFGRELKATNEAIVDELAGFANLLMGEGNGATPVVIIRGVEWEECEDGVRKLYRLEAEDVIKKALLAGRDVLD